MPLPPSPCRLLREFEGGWMCLAFANDDDKNCKVSPKLISSENNSLLSSVPPHPGALCSCTCAPHPNAFEVWGSFQVVSHSKCCTPGLKKQFLPRRQNWNDFCSTQKMSQMSTCELCEHMGNCAQHAKSWMSFELLRNKSGDHWTESNNLIHWATVNCISTYRPCLYVVLTKNLGVLLDLLWMISHAKSELMCQDVEFPVWLDRSPACDKLALTLMGQLDCCNPTV